MGTNGNGERQINLHVPEGMDPRAAQMLFQGLLDEMHELEPLARHDALLVVAQALLNDYPKLAMMRKKIIGAPPGAVWGVSIIETPRVMIPGAKEKGYFIDAFCRMREAKEAGLEAVLKTSNCYGLITSATARGLLQMHGYSLRIQSPFMPEEGAEGTEDEGVEG